MNNYNAGDAVSQQSEQVEPDWKQVEDYITILTGSPDTNVTFQSFDDRKEMQDYRLTRVYNGSLNQQAANLKGFNNAGAGIFFMVNATGSYHGRKAEDVIALRALFIDHDEREGPMTGPIVHPPSMVVQSAGGKHYYWKLKPGEKLDQFTRAQQHLARFYGTDKAVSDLSRVMRVPGFNHRKGASFKVQLLESHPELEYTIQQILDAHPLVNGGTPSDQNFDSKAFGSEFPPADIEPIVSGCSFIRHCRDDAETLSEPEWYAMAGILACCEHGEQLFHTWSEPYTEYKQEEAQKKFDHARDNSGPRTCEKIESGLGWSGCANCPYHQRIKSPVVLGAKKPLMKESEARLILDAVLKALVEPTPAVAKLFEQKTFEALAALKNEDRDKFELELKKILSKDKELKAIVSLPTFRKRLNGAMRARSIAQRQRTQSKLPRILVTKRQFRDLCGEAFRSVVTANVPPAILVRGSELVQICTDEKGRAALRPLNHAQLKHELSRCADYFATQDDGSTPAWPPTDLVEHIRCYGSYPGLPIVAGITPIPIMRSDGSLCVTPGLDQETGLYFCPPPNLVLPVIPENPSDEEIQKAERLIREPFAEFPFVDKSDWANTTTQLLERANAIK